MAQQVCGGDDDEKIYTGGSLWIEAYAARNSTLWRRWTKGFTSPAYAGKLYYTVARTKLEFHYPKEILG